MANSRYALLKNTANFTRKHYFKYEEVSHINTTVDYVCGLKESIESLFRGKDCQEVFSRFSDWHPFTLWEAIPDLSKVATMFSNQIKSAYNPIIESASKSNGRKIKWKISNHKNCRTR